MTTETTATTPPALSLPLPFRPGESWPISHLYDDPRTRACYDKSLEGHEGIDWECCSGTPIHAMAAGTVSLVQADHPDYGQQIRIRTDWDKKVDGKYVGYELAYTHLSVRLVKIGAQVSQGDLIGVSGNTGNSTGPHLHVHFKPRVDRKLNKGQDFANNDFGGATDFKDFLVDHPYLMHQALNGQWPVLEEQSTCRWYREGYVRIPEEDLSEAERQILRRNETAAGHMNAHVTWGPVRACTRRIRAPRCMQNLIPVLRCAAPCPSLPKMARSRGMP